MNKKDIIVYSVMGVLGMLLLVSIFVGHKENSQKEERAKQEIETKHEEKSPEVMEYSEGEESEDHEPDDETSFEELDDIDTTFDKSEIGYTDEEIGNSDFDFKEKIIDKVGKKDYQKIMKRAEKAMELYSTGSEDGWSPIATEKFQEDLKNGRIKPLKSEEKVEFEVFPTEQQKKDKDVIIGAMVGGNGGGESQSFALIFTKHKGDYLLQSMVLLWQYK